MTEARRRCSCGAEISAEAPQGLCPRCLLEAGLAPSKETSDSRQETSPGEPVADPGPLDLAELARLFPQLEIRKLLGRGGMGAVYLARQKALDRLVALKLLSPRPGLDAEFAERFGREARALARLNHPNIVGVYDFGQAEGLFYFLMEYVDGASLREVMLKGRLTPSQALALIPQICDALQYAHDEGIVHRDIKPENILLDKKGRIKIADFGLARLLGASEDERLTGSHHVMGTRNYMAPEQLEHPKQVDHRADIYSLGVVFYEMLTGELPLGRFPPPSKKVHVDVRLDEVVLRALEKEPERRYQHASEIKGDLDEIPSPVEERPTAASDQAEDPKTTRWRLAAFAIASATIGLWFFVRTGNPIGLACLVVIFEMSFVAFVFPFQPIRTKTSSLVRIWLPVAVVFVMDALSAPLAGTLLLAVLLSFMIGGAIRAISAESQERRMLGLGTVQLTSTVLAVYPAAKPLEYVSWIFRLSGAKPGPNDALIVRLLFIAILVILFAWKIQIYRALSQGQRRTRSPREN